MTFIYRVLQSACTGTLPVAAALERLVLNHFDPVAIWVEDECHVVHAAIREAFLPVDL